MRVLLIYPQFPQAYWSFEKALALIDRQALLPPLGLITVAAILPQTWKFKLVDRLYELGWRASIMLVDDNFIGNKRNVKLLLTELKQWMEEHQWFNY